MIDVSPKRKTKRTAVAEGRICLDERVVEKIKNCEVPKGDVLKTSEVAGLLAMKKTPSLIPHCHPVRITKGKILLFTEKNSVRAECEVEGIDRTGFEMEALAGVSVALLTIYDMCKVFGHGMRIEGIRLLKKTGGKKDINA